MQNEVTINVVFKSGISVYSAREYKRHDKMSAVNNTIQTKIKMFAVNNTIQTTIKMSAVNNTIQSKIS